jgi:hypothetical protein
MAVFQKCLVYGFCVVLMISTFPFQATGEQEIFMGDGEEATDIMIEPDDGVFFFPEALSTLTGRTSATGACFPKPAVKTTFNRGESVWFNVYWLDTVEPDRQNVYNVTMAVQAGTLLTFFQNNVDIETDPNPPGTQLEFCVRVQKIVPPNAAVGTFPWGARVIKLSDNTQLQGKLADIAVQGGGGKK